MQSVKQSLISGIGFAYVGFSGFRIQAGIKGEEEHDAASNKLPSVSRQLETRMLKLNFLPVKAKFMLVVADLGLLKYWFEGLEFMANYNIAKISIYDLMGKLRSLKRYLLLDQGDFLVHFMDIAREELAKRLDEIFVEKLQSLLELALRTIAAAADPCHKDLTCCVERSSLLKRLSTLKDLDVNRLVSDSNGLEEPISVIGLETFSLIYKVLEPNWHVMHCKLQTAKSIDEVIRCHDFFLEKCLKECPLLLPEVLKVSHVIC
ncbi:hypothetical protein IFM89_008679, partial [Coptis chinensis]